MTACSSGGNATLVTMGNQTLCIVHHEPGDVGLVARHLAAHGVPAEVRQPNAGDTLPDPENVQRAIIFGGAMSATDDHDPAIKSQLIWIEKALRAGTPLIGICLGAQLIARTLGATIKPQDNGRWEIGYRNITPTEEGREVFADSTTFFQWHQEGFDLPVDAVRLATGDEFPEQAYRLGQNVFGFQFHPEVGRSQLLNWHRGYAGDMQHPGADPLPTQRDDNARHEQNVESWLKRIVSGWIGQTAGKEPNLDTGIET